MKKLPLHWRIITGMVLGVICGAIFTQIEDGNKIISDWIKPFGVIFINALKLIAMPLILGSLIKGVSDLKDISKLSMMGGKTIGIYLVTTIMAVSVGLFMVNTISPGNSIPESTRMELIAAYESDAAEKQVVAQKQKEAGPLQALVDLVPSNIFKATTENGNMLQVIFFALFFGIGLIWFLASKMDLSTLPNRPIQSGDLHKHPDEVSGEKNYLDNLGTGYGWILILIGLAIFSIIFYVYYV